MHDPNDKDHWVSHTDELEFVLRFGKRLRIMMNPAKETDPYAPDLFSVAFGGLADLKVQKEPYRTSENYGVRTEHCVTLNVYDLTRYGITYGKGFPIYFWLNHPQNENNGVYVATCQQIMEGITLHRRKIHGYMTRDGRDGNKTHSWVLNITDFERLT